MLLFWNEMCRRQMTLSKIDEICPLAIPNQISTISMHEQSLLKIHWYVLKLSSGNEKSDVSWAVNSIKNWRKLAISNPKPELHNINVHTKFGENPLTFTWVIIRKRKYRRTYVGWIHGPTWNHNNLPILCGRV